MEIVYFYKLSQVTKPHVGGRDFLYAIPPLLFYFIGGVIKSVANINLNNKNNNKKKNNDRSYWGYENT